MSGKRNCNYPQSFYLNGQHSTSIKIHCCNTNVVEYCQSTFHTVPIVLKYNEKGHVNKHFPDGTLYFSLKSETLFLLEVSMKSVHAFCKLYKVKPITALDSDASVKENQKDISMARRIKGLKSSPEINSMFCTQCSWHSRGYK